MSNRLRITGILLGLLLLAPGGYSQDENSSGRGNQSGSIPDSLRRPDMGEAPRYARDVVIGELGQGESPYGAYRFARSLISALSLGNKNAKIITEASSILTEKLIEEIGSIKPRSYRIGGGRSEADGSVSFLIRFFGSEESITGELYVRRADNHVSLDIEKTSDNQINNEGEWLLDDLILEEKRELTEIRDSYRYDFSPYERFY